MCLEALASVWISTKKRIMREPVEQQIFTAQDNLEQCKKSMDLREHEMVECISKLHKEAVLKKKQGDVSSARIKLLEKARIVKRLDKLRSSMNIIDTQLEAIKSSELDKEIMISLKASSIALKKAGIGVNANEVETVMTELDDHLKEMQDITSVLSTPVNGSYDDDIDRELDALLEDDKQDIPVQVNQMPIGSSVQPIPISASTKIIEIIEEDEDEYTPVTQPLLPQAI